MIQIVYYIHRELIAFYYSIGLISILVILFSRNQSLLLHGKSRIQHELAFDSVPKRYFVHFYVTGFIFNLWIWLRNPSPLHLYYTVNVFRRLVETLFMMRYAKSSMMHILHYVAGLTFYPVTGILVNQNDKTGPGILFGLAFILLSWMQLDIHNYLAGIRSKNSVHQRIPSTGLFYFILCPHYALELLIYLVILLRIPSIQSTLCMLFVFANLLTSAYLTKQWYIGICKDDRWAIIPWLL